MGLSGVRGLADLAKHLMGRPVLLHGLGVEGRAAADALRAAGADITVADERADGALRPEAAHALLTPDTLYLRSPGVPPRDALYRAAARVGATVTTPTGLWLARLAPPGTITVTGTKGKSTTTALLSAVLTAGGVTSAPYGNIGSPPLGPDLPAETAPVVELSSYMGEDLLAPADGRRWFHVVTSLYKEHTDWHGGEAPYRAAKLRPYRFAPPCPGAAPRAVIEAEKLAAEPLEGIRLEEGRLALGGGIDLPALNDAFASPGAALAMRAAAVAARPVLGDALEDAVRRAAEVWRGLPSRQAILRTTDGRRWVDDALATIPEATGQALARFGGAPVRLILGGKDRGQDHGALVESLADFPDVRAYAFGEVAPALAALGVPVFGSMEAAVAAAASDCPPGGVVLFSPAAPSGTPHRDYAERAAIFAALAASA